MPANDQPLRFRWEQALRSATRRPPTISATDQHIGLLLATWTDLDGSSARPSVATLAVASGRSSSTVRGALTSLQTARIVERMAAPTNNTPAEYRLLMAGFQASSRVPESGTREVRSTAGDRHPTGGRVPETGTPSAGERHPGVPESGTNQHNHQHKTTTTTTDFDRVRDVIEQLVGTGLRWPVVAPVVRELMRDGWTLAQLVTVLDGQPEELRNPTGFVMARLRQATEPPRDVTRVPRRIAASVGPDDGWPQKVASPTLVRPDECACCDSPPTHFAQDGRTGWCREHVPDVA